MVEERVWMGVGNKIVGVMGIRIRDGVEGGL